MESQNLQKKSRKLLVGFPMMLISLIIVLTAVPLIMVYSGNIGNLMQSAGIKMHPNIDDGFLISDFEDPSGDLLRKLPPGDIYQGAENALDILKFSVKKVKFRPLSGVGIAPRLNLTYEFRGKLPNPLNSSHEFSLPVIHTYIDAPDKTPKQITSNKIADVLFAEKDWDYQIIIDGFHEQARIYDTEGTLIGTGLGIYINYSYENVIRDSNKTENIVKSTKITAGLPMKLLGDPSKGKWAFYVISGLADMNDYTMMLPAVNETEPQIFDVVLPEETPVIEFDARPKIYPLKINNL